jgi:WD40 repeat protein
VAFALDGKYLAAVGDDGHLRVWRTEDWALDTETRVCKLPLYAVAFPPGQSLVATAGEDGKIYLIERHLSVDN